MLGILLHQRKEQSRMQGVNLFAEESPVLCRGMGILRREVMEAAGDISVEKRWTVTKLKRLHHFGVFTVLFQRLAVLTPKFVEPTNPKNCDGQQEQQPV